jgi:FdhE protein
MHYNADALRQQTDMNGNSVPTFEQHAARARVLAERFPESSEGLSFYASLAELQATLDVATVTLSEALAKLGRLASSGPEPLREASRHLGESSCRHSMTAYLVGDDVASSRSFFARALLQVGYRDVEENEPTKSNAARALCPRCQQPPQVGELRREGDGTAPSLVCAICMGTWRCARGTCPGCGETDERKLVFYHAPEIAHVKLSACESCRRYLHFVDIESEPSAIAEVDEIVALPLDVWAREKGYRKLVPNLLGI